MLECLIVDDDENIAATICEYFNMFNFSSEYVTDYEAGIRAIAEKRPSLILLDINLGERTGGERTGGERTGGERTGGERTGFELCKKLRETSDVPIIFISARNTDDDILVALGVGGDDYITKPFSMAVLLAKSKAMLKRSVSTHGQEPSMVIRFGDVEINRDNDRVLRGGENVRLKPLELKLLLYLIDNKGKRITKDELLENVWQDTFIGEGTLSVHIRHLREKLEVSPHNPRYIKTVWGSGYMFED